MIDILEVVDNCEIYMYRFVIGDSDRKPQQQGNDWKCLDCGNVNWARRDACNKCHVKRPENAPLVVNISKFIPY